MRLNQNISLSWNDTLLSLEYREHKEVGHMVAAGLTTNQFMHRHVAVQESSRGHACKCQDHQQKAIQLITI